MGLETEPLVIKIKAFDLGLCFPWLLFLFMVYLGRKYARKRHDISECTNSTVYMCGNSPFVTAHLDNITLSVLMSVVYTGTFCLLDTLSIV